MKKHLVALFILLAPLGCADLDIEPKNGLTGEQAFSDFSGYKSYMAKIYGSLVLTGNVGPHGDADIKFFAGTEGNVSYIRLLWKLQTQTSEQVLYPWNGPHENALQFHEWGSDSEILDIAYTNMYYLISLTNDFLRVSEELPSGLSNSEIETVQEYRHEARFLRAMAHYHLFDFFRNIPVVTQLGEKPLQTSPREVFEFIENELNDLEGLMVSPGQNEYGRVDVASLWMVQAKLYLNAGVYIGETKYDECIAACQKVINAGIYSLADNYEELFMADNHLRRDEIIFAVLQDAVHTQSWGGTTTFVSGTVGGAMQDNLTPDGRPFPDEALNLYGISSGWDGFRTTSALVEKFPDVDGSTDRRAMFFTEGQTLEIQDYTIVSQGYRVPKWKNIEASTGERPAGGGNPRISSVDFPMYRFADAYLMLAEAEYRNTNTLSAMTLGYLNDIRFRAYGDESGSISLGDISLDWFLDERVREFYWEGDRRTDLIRFGKFSGGEYIWPWKGGVAEGRSIPSHMDIFPIPARQLLVNSALEQNPGY